MDIELGQIWSGRFGAVKVLGMRSVGDGVERVRFAGRHKEHELGRAAFEATFKLVPTPGDWARAELGNDAPVGRLKGARVGAPRACIICKAPAPELKLRHGRCCYCDFATHGGSVSRAQGDRIVGGAMLAEPGEALARGRLEAALRAERAPSTATSRMMALPHPW